MQPIPQPQVAHYLALIEPGLERIHALSDGRASVSTMRQRILNGFWLLWLAYEDGEYIGFVTTEFEKRDNGAWIMVPLTYAKPEHNGNLWEGVEELKRFARSMGCEGLEFETSRKWGALAGKLGFEEVSVRWGLKL